MTKQSSNDGRTSDLFRMLENKLELERGFGVDVVPVGKEEVPIEPDQTEGSEASGTKAEQLSGLEAEIAACMECTLGETRRNLVFGVGSADADLMFIGEAPGAEEDAQGEPFVGRAGKLLTKIIIAMGLKREDVYIANILKCRPPGNRNPNALEVAHCRPYLNRQIEIIQPKVLVCLGGIAAKTLLNTEAAVGSLRGHFHNYEGIPVLVTYHPAYLLRNSAGKVPVWEDMKTVLAKMGLPVPE